MKVTCKNAECKYYYKLSRGEHCAGEDGCPRYTTNKKKALKKIIRCKDCEYCKRIYTDQMKEYHWECCFDGKRRVIFLIGERICDMKR